MSKGTLMYETKLVFVVDDDPSARSALHSLVRSVGCNAEMFESGATLLAHSMEKPVLADCIICDINMPGINGVELQNRLVRRGYRIAFIFVTAFMTDHARRAALSGGALCVLEKPTDPDVLCQWLGCAFARGR
jgi:FixJ family two-component response regulator